MKTCSLNLFLFFSFLITFNAQCGQNTDFFVGKWEISILDSPMGNIKFISNISRINGKLTADLTNQMDTNAGSRKVTKIEESANTITIYFESSQGGEIPINLTKVDNQSLKGTLLTYEAIAIRL